MIPLVVPFGGIVSCLRTYTPDELRALVAGLDADGCRWTNGELPARGPIPVTCVLRLPVSGP